MRFQCSKCKTVFRVDEAKVPEKGAYGRCPKCKERILIKKDQSLEARTGQELRIGEEQPSPEPALPAPSEPEAPEKAPKVKPQKRSILSVATERFRTTFLAFYALSSLVPTLIVLYIIFQEVRPHLTPAQAETVMGPIYYGLLAMLGVPFLGFFLMSWWMKSLANLTEKIKEKTAAVMQDSLKITEKNELIAVEQHLDGLYEELQEKIRQLNEYSGQLVDSKKKLSEMSVTDELTDLYTRLQFDQRLTEEIERAEKYKRQLSLIMVVVDGFKNYKETFGQEAADELLHGLGLLIQDYVGRSDLPFRYGENEFAILLPESGLENAASVAQKLIDAASLTVTGSGEGGKIKVSIGSGVAGYSPGQKDFAEEVGRCIEAARTAGGGGVVLLPPRT